jgi:hypothetical protein
MQELAKNINYNFFDFERQKRMSLREVKLSKG